MSDASKKSRKGGRRDGTGHDNPCLLHWPSESIPFQLYSALAVDVLNWGTSDEPTRPGRSVVIASPSRGDGRTITAINLAIAAADVGAEVLLVDADLGNAKIPEMLGVGATAGLVDTVLDGRGLEELVIALPDRKVSLLPAGRSAGINPFSVVTNRAFFQVLERMRATFDLVVFDTPPLASSSYAAALIKASPDVVGVVRAARTRKIEVARLVDFVRSVDGDLSGLVFNDQRQVIPGFVQRML